jgi:hypothetical protein
MMSRSPTLEGFRTILRRPSFGLAEIAWRWSFGAATALLLTFSFFEYLNTLPVTRGDLVLLGTRHPLLVSQAILHIFRGSAFRVMEAIIVLALTLGAAWIGLASLARAATLKALLAYFRENDALRSQDQRNLGRAQANNGPLGSLLGLNFFRAGAALAATIGCLAAVLLGGAATSTSDPAPGSALLILLTVVMLVWLAWSAVSWFLSLAAIFVVTDGQDTFGAIAAAVNLCRTRAGSMSAAGTWFGLAHLTAFVVATSIVAFPLGFAGVLPAGIVLGGVLLVTLLYFAVADFLYMGRLAAYVAILEFPDPRPAPLPYQSSPFIPLHEGIDPTEPILSDVSLATES